MDNINMNTIKRHAGDKTKITVNKEIDGKIQRRVYKGYTISNIPEECNHWFNYKGLTYVIN